ncbi:MAG: DUF2278 family protein [Proteobacteria bacterium]|nr:DUF2278 family protein [Pseudomonadota bacterium]
MSRYYGYFPPSKVNGHAANQLDYGLFKGRLQFVAPFDPDQDQGAPHYILRMQANDAAFNVAVNSASSVPNDQGDERVLQCIVEGFAHDLLKDLEALPEGLHREGIPKLDYLRTTGLLRLADLKPIPDVDTDGTQYDVNDKYDAIFAIDTTQGGQAQDYFNGRAHSSRVFYANPDDGVIVYTFGFIYPTNDGLHETHMNQGNQRGSHDSENGVGQDGAVIIYKGGKYFAVFTAFETQEVPTDDSSGYPTNAAQPLVA